MFTLDDLRAKAWALGFDLCGVAPVEGVARLEYLREWVARGFAADLGYIVADVERRTSPGLVLPGARTAIVTGTIYNTDHPLAKDRQAPDTARIARYAWGEDYHEVVGRRQHLLLGWMHEHAGCAFEARSYVDTGPVQEKAVAAAAGLGWIGKHTCLINQQLGSWLFLSVVLTTLDLPGGTPVADRCGTCTRCLDVCPTGAIVEPYVLDASRCLSYVTIETRGGIAPAWRDRLGPQVYGCDLCQDVCPWNHAAAVTDDPVWVARPLWREATLPQLWRASDAALQEAIRGSAMYRTKVWRLRRNLVLAMAASGDAQCREALLEPRDPAVDPSLAHPIVVEHLAWACARVRESAPV